MSDLAAWLSVRDFAARAGIGERTARAALKRCLDGGSWRGATLIVAYAPAPRGGGKAGSALQVRADSLPPGLAAAPRGAVSVLGRDELARIAVSASLPANGTAAAWRWKVIEPALEHPARSAERGAAVRAIAGHARELRNGRTGRIGARTVKRWIAAYERDGFAGLASGGGDKARPAIVTHKWDRAVPFDDAEKRRIAGEVARYVRSVWAAGTEHGWKPVVRHASRKLAVLTAEAGFDPGFAEMRRICRLTRHFAERGREYRAVAVMERDAKKFADRQPHIARTIDGLDPMEIVEGDVHHVDVLLRRDDGSTFTPKAVAWLDRANRRLFATLVFPPKGKAVRQEHAIESFCAMVADERWGLPRILCLDLGSEYNWTPFVDDAMKLDERTRPGEDRTGKRPSMIIRTLPYSPQGKSIESAFAGLERSVLSMLPGYIAGDRMKSPTKNLGRAPAVWPGTEDGFRQAFQAALDVYETSPQEGGLNGRSPREVYAAAADAGWERTEIDAEALRTVFATEVGRKVDRGSVSLGGAAYTSREIQALPAGTSVTLRVPLTGPRDRIPVLRCGEYLGIAEPDRPFRPDDPAGAVEKTVRSRVHREAVRQLRDECEPLDMVAEQAALAAAEPAAPVPKVGATVSLGDTAETMARDLAIPAAEARSAGLDEFEARMRRRMEAREGLRRNSVGGGE